MNTLCGVLLLSTIGFADSSRRTSEERSATIVYIDAKNRFLVIGQGKKEGLEAGMTFEILRGGNGRSPIVGKAKLEKLIGMDSMSKLTIVAGNPESIRLEDRVVYRP